MTPGRVSEAMAAAGTMSLGNVVLHVDWNQASIDSNRVCRDGEDPGDYVQWDPAELAYLHDWNVIQVPAGNAVPRDRRRPAPGGRPFPTGSPPRSSIERSRAGSTGSRAVRPTAPGTSCARMVSSMPSSRCFARDGHASPLHRGEPALRRRQEARRHGRVLLGSHHGDPQGACGIRRRCWRCWAGGCPRRGSGWRSAGAPFAQTPRGVEAVQDLARRNARDDPGGAAPGAGNASPPCAASWAAPSAGTTRKAAALSSSPLRT